MSKNLLRKMLMVILAVSFLSGCARANLDVKTSENIPTGTGIEVGRDNGDVIAVNDETSGQEPVHQGITVNKIKFDVIDVSTISEQLKSDIEALKLQRGYEYWLQDDGSYLILISAGEKSTGGYGIEVGSIEDNEGKTIISVTETEPAADTMTTQMITYPFVVISASGITDNFVISDQNQSEYSRISIDVNPAAGQTMPRYEGNVPEGAITGIYQGLADNNSIEVLVGDTYMVFTADNIAQYLDGIETGDTVEITSSISPSDQLVLESIKEVH